MLDERQFYATYGTPQAAHSTLKHGTDYLSNGNDAKPINLKTLGFYLYV